MYGISYKNTVYEGLRCNRKFTQAGTKKSHPVWQSQQCQCTIQKLASIASNREERNVNDVISTTDNEATQGQPS